MSLINLTINGKAVAVEEGTNILEAAKKVNVKIPNLCYLHIDDIGFDNSCASCRVCLVNADGRLVPSCATLAKEGMKVQTNTPEIIEFRPSTRLLHLHKMRKLWASRYSSSTWN